MTALTLSALGMDFRTVFPDALFHSSWSEDGARFLLLLYRPDFTRPTTKRGVLIFQETSSDNRCSDWASQASTLDDLRKDVSKILALLEQEYGVNFSGVDLTRVRSLKALQQALSPYVHIATDKPTPKASTTPKQSR